MPQGLNVVLVRPEIPPNTGNVGRLCVATGSRLHLVGPLGFEINDARLRRAGLDYWPWLERVDHPHLEAFLENLPPEAPLALFSRKASRDLYDCRFRPGQYLIFGNETSGLPGALTRRFPEQLYRIPMFDERVRSLNLSTAVGIAVYEALRQLEFVRREIQRG